MKTDKFSSTEVDKFRSSLVNKLMDDICQTAVSIVVASTAVTYDEVDIVVGGICNAIRNKISYVAPKSTNEACKSKASAKN